MSLPYLAVFEHTKDGFSGFIPDLPGCICSAPTLEEMRSEMQAMVDSYVESLQAAGAEIPKSQTTLIEFPKSSTIDYWVVQSIEPQAAVKLVLNAKTSSSQRGKTGKLRGRLS